VGLSSEREKVEDELAAQQDIARRLVAILNGTDSVDSPITSAGLFVLVYRSQDASRLRARPQDRGFLRAPVANPGPQEWACKKHLPRPRSCPSETHSGWQTDGQRTFSRGLSRLSKRPRQRVSVPRRQLLRMLAVTKTRTSSRWLMMHKHRVSRLSDLHCAHSIHPF